VDAGSFTRAAKELELPISSVSRGVAGLERTLGTRLLQRTTRKLHLTDAGQAYYERTRAALSSLDEAARAASNLSSEPRGTVRVATPSDNGMLQFAEIVTRFSRKYPLVHLEIAMSPRRVDLVAEGFDLALRAGKLDDSTLVARKIGADSLGIYAAPSYLRQRGKPKTLAELAQHDCVLFRGINGKAEWRLSGPRGEESVTVRGPVNVDEMSFVQAAVAAGLGIALLPSVGVRLMAKKGDLPSPVRLLPEYALSGGDLSVVSPSARLQTAAVVAFRDFLVAELTAFWHSA